MCFVLLGGGRIGAKLPETQTIFNAALTIAAQMLRAFQAFLVDNVYRVPRGPCHRQLASKQASQRQKIHKPTAGHSSLPSVAVLLQLYHSRCFRLLQKSFLEHLSSKGRKIGGRSSVSMVALNWMMRVLQQDNARLKSCCLFFILNKRYHVARQ